MVAVNAGLLTGVFSQFLRIKLPKRNNDAFTVVSALRKLAMLEVRYAEVSYDPEG